MDVPLGIAATRYRTGDVDSLATEPLDPSGLKPGGRSSWNTGGFADAAGRRTVSAREFEARVGLLPQRSLPVGGAGAVFRVFSALGFGVAGGPSPDYLISPDQDRLRESESESLSRLQVDDHVELRRLLDG